MTREEKRRVFRGNRRAAFWIVTAKFTRFWRSKAGKKVKKGTPGSSLMLDENDRRIFRDFADFP